MIPILMGDNVEIEVDPNENGLPVLIIKCRYGARIKHTLFLDKNATEQVIQLLQEKLKEM